MKALVTGATGFLGSHLVDLLASEGHEVRCLVRPSSNLRWLKAKNVRLFEGDLKPNDDGLMEACQGIDWFFHVAGLISTADPKQYYQVNVGGTRFCLEAVQKNAPQLKRFVLVSSIAAAGPSDEKINEAMPCRPLTDYGKSKLESEKIALSFKNQFPISIIRPPAIYGPRDVMIYPVFKMAKKGFFILPAGDKQKITMAYVEDVARACYWAAQEKRAIGETFFICDGDIYHWSDIADSLAQVFYHKIIRVPVFKTLLWPIATLEEWRASLMKTTPKIHRGHVRQFFRSWKIDCSKIKAAGFQPKYHLEEGMKATVAGYRQIGWL
ncbi:MAG: NAD-dependent epimerase/dehydratase family protein [Deltaproteobacteria bacterium]|nr:NAD-dependent epimerase/dehydratase family protein [Deltaproteobacteria bacterium]